MNSFTACRQACVHKLGHFEFSNRFLDHIMHEVFNVLCIRLGKVDVVIIMTFSLTFAVILTLKR